MSREAWGDPPERQEPPQLCPVCDSEYHAEDCELGQEVARRLKAEAQAQRLLGMLREAVEVRDGPRWPLPGCQENGTKGRALWRRIEAELKA